MKFNGRENGNGAPLQRIRAKVTAIADGWVRVRITEAGLPAEMRLSADCLGGDEVSDYGLEPGTCLNLLDVTVDGDRLLPRFWILEPDYLVDASSLAECVQEYGTSWQRYFWNRLRPKAMTDSILLGNAVNLMFDELVGAPDGCEITFDSLMPKVFSQYPVELAAQKNIDGEFFRSLRQQFDTLTDLINRRFPDYHIDRHKSVVEPAFVCEPLGLQGRLDFLQVDDLPTGIELKSGRLPYPLADEKRISPSHYTQSVLYRLMIRQLLGVEEHNLRFYVLYARSETRSGTLRAVSVTEAEVRRILNLRNRIVAEERKVVLNGASCVERLMSQLTPESLIHYPNRFTERYIKPEIERGRARLSERTDNTLALRYFYRFYAFVTREQFLSKVGYETGSGVDGAASWWRCTREEKVCEGRMFADLRLVRYDTTGEYPVVDFALPDTGLSPDFRPGDMVLFYICDNPCDTVSSRQVFKANIAEITADRLRLVLRGGQCHAGLLPGDSRYAIEHDYTDVAFREQYRGLYALLDASPHRRGLLVGEEGEQPQRNRVRRLTYDYDDADLSRILLKAVQADDCFLLVGPPGTGKTSVALKNMVREFLAVQGQQILLVAYTNRAVDEICDKLESMPEVEDYIRVGQLFSTDTRYRSHVLSERMRSCRSRLEVRQAIDSCRIFVGTLSSLSGKPELFALKRFDTAIVDEASQILEPQLAGLLSAKTPTGSDAIGKFILIGDHKQLPAIVVQSAEESVIEDEMLQAAGFADCRQSLFERLYRRLAVGDDSPFVDMLDCQWRTYPDIVAFVNQRFYGGKLRSGRAEHQTGELPFPVRSDDAWEQFVAGRRMAFLPTKHRCAGKRYNDEEARTAAEIVGALYRLYSQNGLAFDEHAVGIIAPYRHQIAQIRRELGRLGIPELDRVRVDTVERFQGSQNDCIVYSFSVNDTEQLAWLPSYTLENGVLIDRKLNVALTRPRRQLFVLGNPHLLSKNEIYRELISFLEGEE